MGEPSSALVILANEAHSDRATPRAWNDLSRGGCNVSARRAKGDLSLLFAMVPLILARRRRRGRLRPRSVRSRT
jgi:hypothetical protein